ncbi:Fic family protein [Amycolatopsis endophytica]|uniref:Fic family protein n=1 Tax=Amycolatopsis endophytica TaxID=860233 RepID=A0A853AYJ8_9PSEU|nr:hypothetical protein [Amycolatopsis endophytica]NYI87732.1 Fic family protein [Amycolatopsis endophytica]
MRRNSILRDTSLVDVDGNPFRYALPDEVLRMSKEITKNASGHIGMREPVTNPETRDRYLVSPLIEEAITSGQLEGASTERHVAKEMIRSGRNPATRSERMILNNFHVMQRIGELRNKKLTSRRHSRASPCRHGRKARKSGRIGKIPTPGRRTDRRVGRREHGPPSPATRGVTSRAHAGLCDFANGHTGEGYLPPVLKAITRAFG